MSLTKALHHCFVLLMGRNSESRSYNYFLLFHFVYSVPKIEWFCPYYLSCYFLYVNRESRIFKNSKHYYRGRRRSCCLGTTVLRMPQDEQEAWRKYINDAYIVWEPVSTGKHPSHTSNTAFSLLIYLLLSSTVKAKSHCSDNENNHAAKRTRSIG